MDLIDYITDWFDLPGGTNKLDSYYANETQVILAINFGFSYLSDYTGTSYATVTASTPESDFTLEEKQAIIYYLEYDMCLKSKTGGGSSLSSADKITIKDLSHTVIKETTSGTSSGTSSTMVCEDWLSKIKDLFADESQGLSFATFIRS